MTDKCYILCRVSSNGQITGDGYSRQESACRDYANRKGLSVYKVFYDAISGTREDREQLNNLFTESEITGIKTIVVESADRWARSVLVGEILLAECRKLGIKVITASDNDLTENVDETAKLVRQILQAIAEFDRDKTVKKMRSARDRLSIAKGRRIEGRAQYGQSEYEKGLITRACALRAQGLPLQAISERFNNERLTVREGKVSKWFPAQIARIIARQPAL